MNYAIDTVRAKLKQAIFPFERSPETIQPNTSYPIPQRHFEVKLV
jgi:hypothetical protein